MKKASLLFIIVLLTHFGYSQISADNLQFNQALGLNFRNHAARERQFVPKDTLSTSDSGAIAFINGRFYIKTPTYWVDWGVRKIDDSTYVFAYDTFYIAPAFDVVELSDSTYKIGNDTLKYRSIYNTNGTIPGTRNINFMGTGILNMQNMFAIDWSGVTGGFQVQANPSWFRLAHFISGLDKEIRMGDLPNQGIKMQTGTTALTIDTTQIFKVTGLKKGILTSDSMIVYDVTNGQFKYRAISFVNNSNNGLSLSGFNSQLGQDVGAVGNPAALISSREIPLNGFNLRLPGAGAFSIGDNNGASTARIQVATTAAFSSTPYLSLGPLLSNSIYSTLHTSDTVTAANEASIPLRGYQMNRNLVIGANGNINLTGKNGAADVDVLRVRDTLTLNASGHNNWYANLSGLSFLKAGGYSGRSSIRGGVDGISDAPTAFTAELVIGGSSGSNNFHFYGDWASITAELAHTASAQDTMAHYMSVWANANYAGKIGRGEYFRGFGLGARTDTLHSIFFSEENAMGYHQGKFGIGDSLPLFKLHVNGSAAINRDSLPTETTTAGMHILLSDNSTNQIKKIDPANLPTGSPGLTSTQIAFGNQSNVQTSNAYLRYVDSTKAALSKKFYAGNYVRSGDSTYRFSPFLRSYFFGNSITAGSAISPQYVRWPTRVANGLNHIEYNYGIGQTRLVTLAAGDSAMEERTFLIPTYDANRDGYLFFAYGTNDAVTLSVDTAAFRTAYNSIISNATSKGWPVNRIVLVSNGYYLHSISTLTNRGVLFRNVTESVAIINGTRFVDTRTAQINVGALSTLKLPSDSVHLNEMGNQAWALAVLDTLGAKSGDGRFNGNLSARALHLRAWKNGGIGNAFAANSLPVLLSATDSTEQPVFEIRAAIGSSTNNESMGVGLNALQNMTTGNSNMGIGPLSFQALTTGSNNTAVGPAAGYNTTTGNNITAIGKNALFSNTTNSELTAVGRDALYSNTSGASNTGVGYSALRLNVTGNNQTAVGYAALENATSGGNGAFGSVALRNNVSGTNNNAFGSSSLSTNVSGSSNTAMGNRALRATTVDFNTALGANAGDSVTTGASNTLLGYRSGYNLKTGSNNVIIGPASGLGLVSGSDNIYIGRWTNASAAASGTIAFSPGSNDPRFVSLGDGKTGLGTANPLQRLHVAGKVQIDTLSDGDNDDSIVVVEGGQLQKVDRSIAAIVRGTMSGDGSFTIAANIGLQRLIDITANRTVTMPTPTEGRSLVIWNANTGAFAWNISGSVVNAAGTALTVFANDTVYTLIGTGSEWLITCIN